MTIDLNVCSIIFCVKNQDTDNYRKLEKPMLCVLLQKSGDKWQLPKSKITTACKIDDNISEIIKNQTGLKNVYSEQLYTYSKVLTDDEIEVNQAYISLISEHSEDALNNDCAWFVLSWKDDANGYKINFKNTNESFGAIVSKKLKPQTNDRYSFYQTESNEIVGDHAAYIIAGLERLKNKIDYTNIVFNMMPPTFTLKYLQQIFELINNKKLLDAAFRRTIAKKVEPVGEEKRGSGHRPSMLFKFKGN